MFNALYIGTPGIYKNQEYQINIGSLQGRIVIRRKCGAGKVYYDSIIDFLNNWDKIRKC